MVDTNIKLDQLVGYTARAANASVAKRLSAQGVTVYMNFGTKEIFRAAAAGASADAALVLESFARTMAQSITRLRESRIKTLLTPIGEEAVKATVRRYKASHQGSLSGYRQGNNRQSGGKLLKALDSPNMYRVAQDGIFFINQAHLDQQASHWARLQFGAGRKGKDTPQAKQYRMKFLGQDTGLRMSLEGAPRPSFQLPAGYWGKAGVRGDSLNSIAPWTPLGAGRKGRDQFFWYDSGYGQPLWNDAVKNKTMAILNYQRKFGKTDPRRFYSTTSRGITGTRYLDAGVSRIADALPVAYTALMNEWLREAENKGTGPFVTIAADATLLASARTQIDADIDRIMSSRRLKGLGGRYGF